MSDDVSPGPNGRAGHTPDGKFARGNKLASGNPVAKRMYELRRALLDAADAGTVQRVARKMGELAAEGDVAAAKLYLEYAVGRVPQAIELSGPDGEPIGLDWGRVHTAIMGALAEFPQARVAVA